MNKFSEKNVTCDVRQYFIHIFKLTNLNYFIKQFENVVKYVEETKQNLYYKVVFFIQEPKTYSNNKLYIEFHYDILKTKIHILIRFLHRIIRITIKLEIRNTNV